MGSSCGAVGVDGRRGGAGGGERGRVLEPGRRLCFRRGDDGALCGVSRGEEEVGGEVREWIGDLEEVDEFCVDRGGAGGGHGGVCREGEEEGAGGEGEGGVKKKGSFFFYL